MLAGLAALATVPYCLATRFRNALFDNGLRRVHRVGAQVISVGNLTTGGTGKTPVVALLAAAARRHGRRPAILTRGYRRRGSPVSDEVSLYGRLVPDVPVIVDPDRVRGAAAAAKADLLLLDDGFQHRRLGRDVDLVLADARDPFSGERLLPRGLLRESIRALGRAHALILTRSDRASPEQIAGARRRAREVAGDLPVLLEAHRPQALVGPAGQEDPDLARLAGARVFCFSGIADPGALAETLVVLGAEPAKVVDFGDHHEFDAEELRDLEHEAAALGAALAVTTEKDQMRIGRWQGSVPLVALRIGAELAGEADALKLGELVGFPVG